MRIFGWSCLLLVISACWCTADDSRQRREYEQSILPLLQRYCGDCHSKETSEKRWAFDSYGQFSDLRADTKFWGKAQQLLATHLMPPSEQPAPSADERSRLLNWIDDTVFYVDPDRPDPGRIALRRLNRAEYNNSIRDTLYVETRPADQFPEDDAGYGFDNIGDVLSVSPLHLEKYLIAAREVVDELLRVAAPPHAGVELNADKLTIFEGSPRVFEKSIRLYSSQDQVGTAVSIPVASTYQVLIRAAARPAAAQPRNFEILCDGKPVAELNTSGEWKNERGPLTTAFKLIELPAGEHRISLRVKAAEVDDRDPNESIAAIGFFGFSGPFTPMPPKYSPYLQAAFGARPLGYPILNLSGEELDAGSGRTSLDTGRAWFASNGFRHAPVLLKETGDYRIRFKVGAQQAGNEPVKFEVRVAGQIIGPFEVTAKAQGEEWLETTSHLPAGEHDWQVWFVNEYKDAETGAERYLWLHEFSIEGPIAAKSQPNRDEYLRLLGAAGRRLFRRPLSEAETLKLTRIFDDALASGQSPHLALRAPLEALLVSPRFLYHPMPKPVGGAENGLANIDEFTLASRLSYFLWSSAPDEELLKLAEREELRRSLRLQVQRMLRDPRSSSLTRNFAGQWLRLRDLENAAPDPATFPEFNASLAEDMRHETELMFEHILRNNRSVLEFLDADYTFINSRLAAFYGLSAQEGADFERISLQGSPRRGVLTHASILTITSHPTRTAPVKRGKWILEQFLGIETPPPPQDVPPLAVGRENESESLRKRLEAHRSNAACASCHALLDPLGFALENYDAIGRWRTADANHAVDPSGQLMTGETFSDWTELRQLLVEKRRNDFVRCFTEQLMTYGLGRGVTWRDKLFVREIVERTATNGHAFQDLIFAICDSTPMQKMRTPSP